jgi:hypothetical protein
MALTLDPKRCAVLAMDYQNEILEMIPPLSREESARDRQACP